MIEDLSLYFLSSSYYVLYNCHNHQHYHSSNNDDDIRWRAVKRAQISATKEPENLSLQNGKRPDGSRLIPWSRGKPMTWDVNVPCTYAESHTGDTATEAGAAANQAAANKIAKYDELASTHIFYPVAIETGGTWHWAVELVQEIGRRATLITGEPRESTFLFQQ